MCIKKTNENQKESEAILIERTYTSARIMGPIQEKHAYGSIKQR